MRTAHISWVESESACNFRRYAGFVNDTNAAHNAGDARATTLRGAHSARLHEPHPFIVVQVARPNRLAPRTDGARRINLFQSMYSSMSALLLVHFWHFDRSSPSSPHMIIIYHDNCIQQPIGHTSALNRSSNHTHWNNSCEVRPNCHIPVQHQAYAEVQVAQPE